MAAVMTAAAKVRKAVAMVVERAVARVVVERAAARAAAKVAAVMTVVERAAVARAAAKVARAATCSVRRNLGSRCRSRTPVVCRRGQTSSPRLHPGTRHCRPVHRCRRTAWVVVVMVAMAEVFARPRR